MNTDTLKEAANRFLDEFPGGFQHPEMLKLGKKHKMEQLHQQAKDDFSKKCFDDSDAVVSAAAKIISRSTMVSMFEKPKFKSMVSAMSADEKKMFADALFQLLHGKEGQGFEMLVSELQTHKLSKWPLATIIQAYYKPQKQVFVKPTTTKLIIERLNLDLEYKPKPTWEFYRKYRKIINEIKSEVDASLSPNNPAFCGFLMMQL